jgi:hypothetical protein
MPGPRFLGSTAHGFLHESSRGGVPGKCNTAGPAQHHQIAPKFNEDVILMRMQTHQRFILEGAHPIRVQSELDQQ